jgi:hypothetical protein
MKVRNLAVKILTSSILCGAPLVAFSQSNPQLAALTGTIDIEIQFTRAHGIDELRRLCAGTAMDATSRSCSFSEASVHGGSPTCVIVALEPETFNDMARLVAFGRETLNCLAEHNAPMATGVRR